MAGRAPRCGPEVLKCAGNAHATKPDGSMLSVRVIESRRHRGALCAAAVSQPPDPQPGTAARCRGGCPIRVIKRVAAAVGEGSAAVRSVREHLAFLPHLTSNRSRRLLNFANLWSTVSDLARVAHLAASHAAQRSSTTSGVPDAHRRGVWVPRLEAGRRIRRVTAGSSQDRPDFRRP